MPKNTTEPKPIEISIIAVDNGWMVRPKQDYHESMIFSGVSVYNKMEDMQADLPDLVAMPRKEYENTEQSEDQLACKVWP